MNIKKLFIWQSTESILYHILLGSHLYGLYLVMPTQLYGLMGTLFSIIYLAVPLINGGLDDSLAPLFGRIKQSRSLFCTWLFYNSVANGLLYLCAIGVSWYIISSNTHLAELISPSLFFVMSSIVAIESGKKNCKTMLQLSLNIQTTVLGELCMMAGYISMVWSAIWLNSELSLFHIFLPMLICSLLELLFFIYRLYGWINTLNIDSTLSAKYLKKDTFKLRLTVYTYAIATLFSSTNIMIPIVSSWYGLAQAAQAKLITSLMMNGLFIIKRITETVSMIAFNQSIDSLKDPQSSIFKKIHMITLYPIAIACIFAIAALWTSRLSTTESLIISSLCIIIPCLDVAFITYKRWYIQKHQVHILLKPYLYFFSSIILGYFFLPTFVISGVNILCAVCMVRLISILFMIQSRSE